MQLIMAAGPGMGLMTTICRGEQARVVSRGYEEQGQEEGEAEQGGQAGPPGGGMPMRTAMPAIITLRPDHQWVPSLPCMSVVLSVTNTFWLLIF